MLRNKGLTRQVTVPVSAGLLADTRAYFAALTTYHDGDAAPIVERFAGQRPGYRERASAGRRSSRYPGELEGVITARSDSAVWKVADLLSRRPVVNAALLAQELGIESTNAHRYLNPLAKAGILVETTSGPRSRVWRSPEVLARSTHSPNGPAGEPDFRGRYCTVAQR